MNLPFAVYEGQSLVGSERKYELRYFTVEQEARDDCEGIPGAFVMQTSAGIWRAAVPE